LSSGGLARGVANSRLPPNRPAFAFLKAKCSSPTKSPQLDWTLGKRPTPGKPLSRRSSNPARRDCQGETAAPTVRYGRRNRAHQLACGGTRNITHWSSTQQRCVTRLPTRCPHECGLLPESDCDSFEPEVRMAIVVTRSPGMLLLDLADSHRPRGTRRGSDSGGSDGGGCADCRSVDSGGALKGTRFAGENR
jgi:hypothetical protein